MYQGAMQMEGSRRSRSTVVSGGPSRPRLGNDCGYVPRPGRRNCFSGRSLGPPDLLQERGFKNIDVTDMESRDDGNRIVVEIAAKRKGNERDVTDRDSGEAELSS
jgi:hypothetical protein